MASAAKVTRVDFLEANEVDGTVVALTTRARVVGLTDTSVAVLQSALNATGIPLSGSALAGYDNLTLRERNPTIVDGEPGVVDIDLVYAHFDNKGQQINAPLAGGVVGSVTASVNQVSSNLDIDGKQIFVQHTWPASDNERAGVPEPPQGGEIQVYQAQRTINFEGIKVASRPWLIANTLIGAINSVPWMGGAVHEWMCVGVTWDILDRGAQSYRVNFSFQHNPDTWNPLIVFIDTRTGKPPVGLVAGVGYKTIRKHPEQNFERIIGARLQGA